MLATNTNATIGSHKSDYGISLKVDNISNPHDSILKGTTWLVNDWIPSLKYFCAIFLELVAAVPQGPDSSRYGLPDWYILNDYVNSVYLYPFKFKINYPILDKICNTA